MRKAAAAAEPTPATPPPGGLRELLASIDQRQARLLERLGSPPRKHWVDYAAAAAALLTPLVIAFGGWTVTQRVESLKLQDQRDARRLQAENRDLQVVQPFLPFLFGDDENKKAAAVQMIRTLGDARLAAYAASIRPSRGTAVALQRIAASSGLSAEDRNVVLNALRGFPDSLRLTPIPADSSVR